MLELAGLIGIEPWGMRLSELVVMAKARSDNQWNHTASILATVLNAGLRPKRPFRASEFHPIRRQRPLSIAESVREFGPRDRSMYKPVSTIVTPPPPKENT